MENEKLQIKLLSSSGELLNVINCRSGQVTVFRAVTAEELKPYQRALSGVPGPERFSISLDEHNFEASQHNLVGFGEEHLAHDQTVPEHLSDAGVPNKSINSIQ